MKKFGLIFSLALLFPCMAQGMTFVVGQFGYETLEDKPGEVMLYYVVETEPIYNPEIPASVVYEGETYKVTKLGGHIGSLMAGNLVLPESITELGMECFSGARFTGTLIIPSSVTTIGVRAFAGCDGFTGTLTIPSSVTEIGIGAFNGCSGFIGTLIIPPSVTVIEEATFANCTNLNGLVISEGVEKIGREAFAYCQGLSGTLTIPNTVNVIDEDAFTWCKQFDNLTLGSSLTEIRQNAFYACLGLSGEIVFPESVSIGGYAFKYCDKIQSLVFTSKDVTIKALAFPDNKGLEYIVSKSEIPPNAESFAFPTSAYEKPLFVPEKSIDLYKNACEWRNFKYINPGQETTVTVTLNVESIAMYIGQSDKLTATVTPDNTTDKTVTWKSDNEAVATVSADGTVTAVSVGVADITATCGAATAHCKVTVNPVPAAGIILNAQDMTLLVGQSDKLTATVTPDNTTDKTVTWKSDNEAVATVSTDGTVTAVSVGVADITATCGEATAHCKVTVNAPHETIQRPDTPTEYVRKGNGTSCTFVVMMKLSDEELNRLGYNFVYGFTDPRGQEHIIDINNLRYCHTSAQIYNDSANDFWVYAFLQQEGGAIVNGLRRHLDGRIDDDADFEILNDYLSRSADMGDTNNWIRPTAGGARITLSTSESTCVYVHTINGKLMYSQRYDSGVAVFEEISAARFNADTYVVTVQSGNAKITKKVVVR